MSQYSIDMQNDDIDVCLGFDQAIKGFWLFVQDNTQTTHEKDVYLFHNLDDVPGFCMTIPMVEKTLEKFGVGLAPDLLKKLVLDAITDGYIERLNEQHLFSELQEFNEICSQLRDNSWKPRSRLSCNWKIII